MATVEYLENKLKELQAEAVANLRKQHADNIEQIEDRVAKVRAEREADRVIFALGQQKLNEPQRRAEAAKQLSHDKEIFATVCRKHLIANIEANFSLLRSVLSDFTEYNATQAITSGAVRLAGASQTEKNEWAAADIENHNQALLNASDSELRKIVKQEAEARQQANQQEAHRLHIEATQARDSHLGFPKLPDTWNGQKLDAAFIKSCSVEVQKLLSKRFGSSQLNARLQGRG
jgi:hypothetical protein